MVHGIDYMNQRMINHTDDSFGDESSSEKVNHLELCRMIKVKDKTITDDTCPTEFDALPSTNRKLSFQYERPSLFDIDMLFVKERSVESDCGVSSTASVIDTLAKLARSVCMNKDERVEEDSTSQNELSKKKEKIKLTNTMRYSRPNNLISSCRVFERFREEDEQKKAVKQRIINKVMAAVKHPKHELTMSFFERVGKLELPLCYAHKKLSAFSPRKIAKSKEILKYDCEEELLRARPNICRAKPSVQRLQDLMTGWYCYPTSIRTANPWEKVGNTSCGMKKMCEMFAPKAKNSGARAKEIIEEGLRNSCMQRNLIINLGKLDTFTAVFWEDKESLVEFKVKMFYDIKSF